MKNKTTFLKGNLAATVAACFSVSAYAEPPKQLRFGLLPAEDPTLMVEQFSGIAKHIFKQIRREYFESR